MSENWMLILIAGGSKKHKALLSIPQNENANVPIILNICFNICYYINRRYIKLSSSREVIKNLEKDGWFLIKIVGSHHHYKHSIKTGKVTVPHPKKGFTAWN